ncbi:hypothetical protein QWZ06_21570 [Chryseobacterium tructae]|nr:hypothetical protein [Chryseobacterium tructae]MDN3694671.1 hypothetical protein [Chryseobacterium tructae]
MASVAAFPAIAGASVKKGDATVAGNIAGKALGTAVIEGGMAVATEGAASLVRNIASKAGGTAAKTVAGASESVDYGKMLTSTSEFDPSKTLYRGLSGKEAIKSEIYLTDNVEVAQSYVKNGQQVMQYDLSNSGLYMLEKTGELEFKTGINTGSTTISTEYLFKGKDLVKTINGKATPYNP